MTEYKVIDNFLPSDVFDKIHELLLFPTLIKNKPVPTWTYSPNVMGVKAIKEKEQEKKWGIFASTDQKLFYMVHIAYDRTIASHFYDEIMPYCKSLDIKALIRIKINMFPNTEILKEHGMHIDYKFPHKGALFSVNTCDGYTKLEDGTKIDSVANRMLLFEAGKPHSSTTCTNQPVRVTINFNYF